MTESEDIHRLSKWENWQEARGKLYKKGLHTFEYTSLSQEYNGSLQRLVMEELEDNEENSEQGKELLFLHSHIIKL